MAKDEMFTEEELAALAKAYREASGKNRADAARELGVARPTLIFAEDKPDASLTKLRIRIIETYSSNKVIGPRFWLKKHIPSSITHDPKPTARPRSHRASAE